MSSNPLTYEQLKSLGADEFQRMFLAERIKKYGTDDLRLIKSKKIPHIEKTNERIADLFKQKRNYFLKMSLKTKIGTAKKKYISMANVYNDCMIIMLYQTTFDREYCEWCYPYLLK